jgi:hypothetical protein
LAQFSREYERSIMKKEIIIIAAFALFLVAPVHSAFAYGGGNGGGDDVSASRGDSTTPPAGFEPTEQKDKPTRSDDFGRTQLTPEEEKEIVEKIGRQLTPEERRTLEEMKSLNERAKKAFQEGDTEGAKTFRNWAISRWDDIPQIRDFLTLAPVGEPKLVLLDDMTEEEWAKSSQLPPPRKGSGDLTFDPSKQIIVSGETTLTPASDKTKSFEIIKGALHDGDTIVAGKKGATITWPNGAKVNLKPNTKIQIHPSGFRVRVGGTWIRLRNNEKTKGFDALTHNAGAPRG